MSLLNNLGNWMNIVFMSLKIASHNFLNFWGHYAVIENCKNLSRLQDLQNPCIKFSRTSHATNCGVLTLLAWRFMMLKTNSLQQAPRLAHGGRMKIQVKASWCLLNISSWLKSWAAFSPFPVISFPIRSPGTKIKNKKKS